jgi:hypothetical protein
MSCDIIVFLGPTMSHQEAKAILPDACYHDPIRCGDIFRALRLNPKTILIIDGYFEETAAVWHKEILFALSQGVNIIGASSMGALRASELYEYGMHGIGKIFELYKQGKIIGDDEVAVIHDDQYISDVTPLVSVRIILEKAIKEKVIDDFLANNIINRLQFQPYFNRSIFKVIENYPELNSWLAENYFDQKLEDAKEALQYVTNINESKVKKIKFPITIFTKRLYREISATPFKKTYDWLGDELAIKKLVDENKLISHLAKLLQLYYNVMGEEFKRIDGSFDKDYINLFKLYFNAPQTAVLERLAYLFSEIMGALEEKHTMLSLEYQQSYANAFRRQYKLFDFDSTQAYFAKADILDASSIKITFFILAHYHYLIEENAVDLLKIETSMDMAPWLARAVAIA